MSNIEEKLKLLPLEIQDALTSPEFGDKIDAIGEKHGLHIDQTGELVNEVSLILLGETRSADFLENIKKSMEITDDKARAVVEDVNNEIFLPLREVMQEEGMPPTPPHILETPDEILKHIEETPELPAPPKQDLTEHLLKNTVASPHIEEKKTYDTDPYREPLS